MLHGVTELYSEAQGVWILEISLIDASSAFMGNALVRVALDADCFFHGLQRGLDMVHRPAKRFETEPP